MAANITLATLDNACNDAITAIEADDFATAKKKAVIIRLCLLKIPDQELKGRDTEFGREAIDGLLKDIKSLEQSSSNAISGRVVYANLEKMGDQ